MISGRSLRSEPISPRNRTSPRMREILIRQRYRFVDGGREVTYLVDTNPGPFFFDPLENSGQGEIWSEPTL